MENNRLPTFGRTQVTFDPEVADDSSLESFRRVLNDPTRGIVQAPAGDWTNEDVAIERHGEQALFVLGSQRARLILGFTDVVGAFGRPGSPTRQQSQGIQIESVAPNRVCGSASSLVCHGNRRHVVERQLRLE